MTVWKKIENGNLYAVDNGTEPFVRESDSHLAGFYFTYNVMKGNSALDPPDAIYNYTASSPRQLPLEVGELVHIIGESQGWFWAISFRKNQEGAIPKSYVVARDCTVERCGEVTLASAGGVGVAHDIALTLRDWLFYWKKLYVNNDERFKFMEVSMRALLELRAQAASGALPQDQLKKISRTAIFTIDKGNRSLGMELAVRNSSGQPIDPMSMSTYELNALHEEANARIDKNMESTPHAPQTTSTARAYTLLVSINNLICRSVDTCVPLLALLRANLDRITEACKLSTLPNSHVAFTDLGSDIKKEKVYLVCYVIRIGSMEPQNVDIRRASLAQTQSSESQGGSMRRPFGIACADITRYLAADDPHLDIRLPFYACEKENMDTLLRKIMTNKDLKEAKHSQGLWVSLQLIEGDLKQIREEHPHLILGTTIKARKIGFPEVILPGDARNDLYVTVVGGSFSKGGKSSERNIELCARLVDKHGKIIPNVISIGAGSPLVSEFTSIVYYHDDRPRWQEVFKVCLNIETFKESHIVFFVRHRSSNEAKDRQELRFSMSYLRLMQKDGTTTPDMMHNLCVYKLDSKHGAEVESEASALCLALPVHKDELPEGCERGLKRGPLSLVHRDVLTVNTTLCSTKLTQREEILGVLKWNTRRAEGTLRHALIRLMSVPGEELVKFLQDILDALFAILTQVDEDSDGFHDQSYGVLVLDCLLRVISVVSDHKFQHFQPVLHVYIDNSFCDALAYEKLISVMVWVITSADQGEIALKRLLQCMKCLECVLRFVARSRQLRSSLSGPDTEHDFRSHFQSFLEALVWLMRCGDHALTCQGSALKYWPQAVSHVITVYPHTDTSLYTVRALNALPMSRLSKQRVLALRELVKGPLCRRQSARAPLFLHAASTIASLLKAKNEVELCIETIGEMMSLLNRTDIGPVEADRTETIRRLLPTAMRCAFAMIKQRSENVPDDPHLRRTICVLLDMVRQMSTEEYSSVVKALEVETSSSGAMLSEALQLLTSLLQRPVFSVHWADMLHLQMNIMLHALRLMSTTLRSRLHHSTPLDFSSTVAHIRSWFDACASLATSKELNEPVRLTRRQKDMCVEVRRGVPVTMCDMWDSLGTHKMSFIPHVVSAFLEVSFLKDDEVRYATIPLLFDMMRVHFEHSRMCQENVDNPLKILENELIDKIDVIAERGGGDVQWRSMFVTLCGGMAALAEPDLRDSSAALIAACARQLDALLDYRSATSQLHKMHLTTGVLNFYEQIDRPAQYIRYVHKLANMHRQTGQWAEAGLCLKLHAKLLKWNGDPLESTLRHPEEEIMHSTHRELKEYLYLEIAELLNRGHQWELAVENVKELVTVYEENLAGYGAMAQLHTQLANTYTAMLTVPRSHPQYFRVLYHGKGFPEQFRNEYGFIYRGNEYEQLQEFRERMLDEWPDANVLNKLDPPGPDITESEGQYLQINPVEPEMSEKLKRFSGKPAASQILQYYKHNNVDKFSFSRPYHKAEEAVDGSMEDVSQNEFATRWLERTELEIRDKLPGIVRWSVVTHQRTYSVCPLEAAVEALSNTNETLKRLILSTRDNDDPLHPLSMRLNGILDPAVMGGTANYEKAFLTQSYLERHPEHAELRNRLLDLIADQIPLLKYGLEVHKARMPPALEALHDHMQKCFNKMQNHVHQRYGKKMGDFEPETPEVQLRITLRDSLLTDPGVIASNRISDVSSGNDSISKSKFSLLNSAVNPLASRNSSGGVTNYFGTLQNSPKRRDKRRARKSEIGTSSSGSQWYTSTPNGTANNVNENKINNVLNNVNNNIYCSDTSNSNASTPLRELRQELVTERPLRAEVERERRLSQRASLLTSSAPPSNRDSLGTTDSNQDEDEPPPLPQKSSHRSSDIDVENNNNATEPNPVLPPRYNYDTVISPRGSFLYTSMVRKNLEKGPTPPPKKKNMQNHN